MQYPSLTISGTSHENLQRPKQWITTGFVTLITNFFRRYRDIADAIHNIDVADEVEDIAIADVEPIKEDLDWSVYGFMKPPLASESTHHTYSTPEVPHLRYSKTSI